MGDFRHASIGAPPQHGDMTLDKEMPMPQQGLSQRQIGLVFGGLLLGMLLGALDQTIVATALPTIVGELGGLSQLSWVVTAYLLASTVSFRCGASWVTCTAASGS